MDITNPPDAQSVPPGPPFPVIGVGASAGGIAAVQTMLQGMPSEPDMAFVVVLHLSPEHESSAAQIFQGSTRMKVQQVDGLIKIERNNVYVIPPTRELQMIDGHLRLHDAERPRGRHVVIDRFFRTLAETQRERAVGIVLSGTGSDGAAGIGAVKAEGGVVIAQDPLDAEFDGMPSSAIATGHVDIVMPAADMAGRLVDLWQNAKRIEIPGATTIGLDVREPTTPEAAEAALRNIMRLLQQRTGHDFRGYKRATLLRRIERRMQVVTVKTLPEYLDALHTSALEARLLLDDILIGVTQFFRDRKAFEALERDVIPQLFDASFGDEPLRAWVPACSTGEEAYSVAMLLAEEAARAEHRRKVNVFATDIDERAIALAREGRYGEHIVVDIAPPRLRAHFGRSDDRYRISKAQRDMMVFAMHNVLRDPPFSRLDLVSCRNLLIYLDRSAQHEVLETFHFALRPGGYLFLGSSESVDGLEKLFHPIDKQNRIYRSTSSTRSLRPSRLALTASERASAIVEQADAAPTGAGAASRAPSIRSVHQRMLSELGPPSAVIGADNALLHLSPSASAYFRFTGGEPTHNALQAVHPQLRHELRTCLYRVSLGEERVDAVPVALERAGEHVLVRVSARRSDVEAKAAPLVLVVFDELPEQKPVVVADEGMGKDPTVVILEAELDRRQEQLQSVVEQFETSSEELKAANEELQAINEELRSATEELETSKEELQSTNEELVTVNHELKSKVEETTDVNDDLQNLIAATEIAVVFVDAQMRIKRFTPAAGLIFNMIDADSGRSLFDITHRLDYPALAEDARVVFGNLQPIEKEVQAQGNRWFLVRLAPYRTADNKIGGIVLTLIDVTGRRRAEFKSLISEQRMGLVAETMTDFAILTLDNDGRFDSWNTGAQRLFGYSAGEAIGQHAELLFTPDDRAAGIPEDELAIARESGRAPDDRWLQRKGGSRIYVSGVTTALRIGEVPWGYAKICRDFTARHDFETSQAGALDQAERGAKSAVAESALKSEFLAVMSHELKHPLNLISVNAQLLMTLPEAQPHAQVMRAARTIQRTVQGQARIIDDLLDLSRSDAGKLSLDRSPLLLVEALQSCINWALVETRAKGIRLYSEGFDEPLLVDGDSVRIEQICWNLLSNAIKFTRAGGSITVRLTRDRDAALLEVADTGKGVAPEFLPHVFDMFRQSEGATTRELGGLGIGLALVKSLVELHGGRVAATSEGPGRGATFCVWLPLHENAIGLASSSATPGTAGRLLDGKHVLLVDDTVDTLETFSMLLEAEGATVTQASSGQAALDAAARQRFDLLVSDIGMPQMDGYELIEKLRAQDGEQHLPAIAITGYGRPKDVQRAFESGFDAHLDKPVDFAKLRMLVRDLLRKAERTNA